jgi:hypothetical protein
MTFQSFVIRATLLSVISLANVGCESDPAPAPSPVFAGFDVSAPTEVKAGVALTVQVAARASTGGRFRVYQGTLGFETDDSIADVPLAYTVTAADNGEHRFSITLKTAGRHVVRIVDSNAAASGSLLVNVTPAAFAGLTIVSGGNQGAPVGKALAEPLAVKAADAFGNGISGALVGWASTAGGGSVATAISRTDAVGIGSVVATLGGTGENAFAATVETNSVVFRALGMRGDVANLRKVSGDAQSATVGGKTDQPLVVRATDAVGSPYPGVTVSWSIAAGNGAIEATSTTGMDGLAKATPAMGPQVGENTFAATAMSLPALSFRATGTPGAPKQLTVVSGDAQVGIGGMALQAPFVVKVLDAFGNGVPNANVVWSVVVGEGKVKSLVPMTDVAGNVSAVAELGLAARDQSFAASVQGLGASAMFGASRNPYRLVYTPPAGGVVRLVRNPSSTDVSIVLDYAVSTAPARPAYAAGFDLPLDTTKVLFNSTTGFILPSVPPLNPGSSPVAASAALPNAGPLARTLVTAISQKALGAGAVTSDTMLPAGAVLYSVALALNPESTPGVVFDGTAAPIIRSGGLRNKIGEAVVSARDVGIGKLEVVP